MSAIARGRPKGAALAVQLVGVVQSGQPSGQPLDGGLELGMQVDEGSQLLGEPAEAHLVFTPAGCELLDSPIREVHDS